MLSRVPIAETIEVPYSTVVPATPLVFDLQSGIPHNVSHFSSRIVAAGAIVLSSLSIFNEVGAQVLTVTIIPFQFAGTTVDTTTMQTPEPANTPFFGPALAGFMPKEFHIFNGWSVVFLDFLATPGVSFDGIFTLEKYGRQ